MLIACDIDGVLCDIVTPLLEFNNDTYGTDLTRDQIIQYELEYAFKCSQTEALRRVNEFYDSSYFDRIRPLEGARKGIGYIGDEHDIVIITSRTNRISKKTSKWLQEYFPDRFGDVLHTNLGFEMESNYSKAKLCDELGVDVLIEDCLRYAMECSEFDVRVLLMNQPWNQTSHLSKDIIRMTTWRDIALNLCEQRIQWPTHLS